MFTIRSSGRHHPTLCVDNLSLSNRNAARTATGRPILGHANFAPKNIEPDAQLKKEQQLGVAIHEITHALGYQPLPFLSIVIFSIYFIRVARHWRFLPPLFRGPCFSPSWIFYFIRMSFRWSSIFTFSGSLFYELAMVLSCWLFLLIQH